MSKLTYLVGPLTFVLASAFALPTAAQEDIAEFDMDGLVRVEDGRVGLAYINPDADFSVFKRVAILDTYVSFRINWQRVGDAMGAKAETER